MSDAGEIPRPTNESSELMQTSDEVELEPFIELAREIQREVAKVVADDSADAESLTEAIDAIPRQARQRVAQAVFDRLPAEVQWQVLERVFDDAEIREYLQAENDRRSSELSRSRHQQGIVDAARAAGQLDTRLVPAGETLTIGLFREADARVAVGRGQMSATCARRIALLGHEPGELRVLDDVFNPRGGYFVTRDYDERSWQEERLAAHTIVRVGSLHDGSTGEAFEPVLYPGGRADFETRQGVVRGRLHVGFVILGGSDVFAG